ncbi:MAG: response regulator [Syntrophales bacterium]
MAQPTEIIKSRVSVYEIELDLTEWKYTHTDQIPGFHDALLNVLPTLKEHKCMSGKPGGFSLEMRKGTNFAHVIEHVILELIFLSDKENRTYTGWTRERNKHPVYVIHYSAPDFLTGRLAAILSVDLVKKLIDGKPVEVESYIKSLRDPVQYLTQEGQISAPFEKIAEPVELIRQIEGIPVSPAPATVRIRLSEKQIANIKSVLTRIRKHLKFIEESWRKAFLEYSGGFGKAIIDKIELLNIDKFIDTLVAGNLDNFYRAIRKVGQVINSYRIPINFVVYSIWLYHHRLLVFLIEEYSEDKTFLHQATRDFEDFFQTILQNAYEGFSETVPIESRNMIELKEFREITERKGYILIVDDDEMVRSAFRDILEYNGYWTLLAQDGAQAMEVISKRLDEISMVILDLFLPDMAGEEIYNMIREARPDTRVLIMTDHSSRKLKEMFPEESAEIIYKPFTAESLLKKVRSLLDRS